LHVAPAPRVPGQRFVNKKSLVFGPVSDTFVKVTGDVPGFWTPMICEVLGVPNGCELKIKFGGVSASVVAAEAGGGLAMTMPKGSVAWILVVSVFVEAWITEIVAGGGSAT